MYHSLRMRIYRVSATKDDYIIMTKEERWDAFICELRAYIEVHHLGSSKHTTLYNQCRYFKRSFDKAQEPLSPEMAERKRQLDEVLYAHKA